MARKQKPRIHRDKRTREWARRTRDDQWRFMERCAAADPLWFCVWNKRGLPEGADEWRECLIGGLELSSWMRAHPDWFEVGEWNDERYATPVRLTKAGRAALAARAPEHDMEWVEGGLVEPGYKARPLPAANMRSAA